MNKSVQLAELSPVIREVLSAGGEVRLTITGNSMLPLLRHRRDSVLLERPNGRLRKYEVPLYRRKDGKFVLHRVIKVRKQDYVLCGDNQTQPEYGVTDDGVLAVVKGIYRDQEYFAASHPAYRRYVRRRCFSLPFRAARVRLRAIFLRVRRLLGEKAK